MKDITTIFVVITVILAIVVGFRVFINGGIAKVIEKDNRDKEELKQLSKQLFKKKDSN